MTPMANGEPIYIQNILDSVHTKQKQKQKYKEKRRREVFIFLLAVYPYALLLSHRDRHRDNTNKTSIYIRRRRKQKVDITRWLMFSFFFLCWAALTSYYEFLFYILGCYSGRFYC